MSRRHDLDSRALWVQKLLNQVTKMATTGTARGVCYTCAALFAAAVEGGPLDRSPVTPRRSSFAPAVRSAE